MFRPLLLLTALALSGAACGPVQAKTPAPDPPLETPAPPHRLVVPVTVAVPDAEPAPIKPAATAPAVPPSRPERPASPPPATPPPVTQTIPPDPPPPAPVLQTTANPKDVEQRTRALLSKASGDLARVDLKVLSRDARDQYDQARRFVRLAEDALKDNNVIYARELAEKAAALASLLVKLLPVPGF